MLKLFTWPTQNARKISIMLEECNLDYEIHAINIEKDEQHQASFKALNPNCKIPVLMDTDLTDDLGNVEAIFETTTAGNSPEQKVWVYDASNQRAVMRKVEVGSLQGDRIVIISGLKEGEQVIAAGVHSLTSDTKVRPWVRERGL